MLLTTSKDFHLRARSLWDVQVYGPCGDEGSADAMEDLIDGRACTYSNRAK
jgi:hypothetical protein